MDENNNTKKSRALTLRPGFVLWAVLSVFALLMTQILPNVISAVFFWFILSVMPISFIILLISSAVMQVYVFCDKSTAEKHAPVLYEIRIINSSPLPIPFVEAVMTKPEDSGVRCRRQRLILSMSPFGGYSVKTNVAFKYRGLYEIGVAELYIYDPLRMFCICKDVSNYSNVTVAPRSLELDEEMDSAVSDIPTAAPKAVNTRERAEVSDIREYRIGDQLKSVHWKLSSKSEELQVKDYSTNNDRHTYILIDLAKPTPMPAVEEDTRTSKLLIKKLKSVATPKKGNKEASAERKRKARRRRLRAKGVRSVDAETIETIDAFINETTAKGRAKKAKEAEKAAAAKAEAELREAAAKKLESIIDEEKAARDAKADAIFAWGGAVLPEFEDEIAEYCADSVVEIAVAAVISELRCGNLCTVAWYDMREAQQIVTVDIASAADLSGITSRFATAPVVSTENRVSHLTRIIGEAVNVTVKIVTSNIDPVSINEYCAVPTAFGGAGTGCSAEVLLFDPEEKYTDINRRIEYTSSAYLQLRQWGVEMSNIKERSSADGQTHLYNFNV